jgi:hypothetical protein
VRGKRSLTNLVEIASHEWKVWIKRAPSAGRPIGSKLFKNVSTSKIIDLRKQEPCNEKDPADPTPWIGSACKGSG